jgi:mono/diheme cytochrome c family protein
MRPAGKVKAALAIGLGGLSAAAGAAWFLELEAIRPKATTKDAERIARGLAVYQERCALCHGANLEGQPNWRVRLPDGKLPAPPHDASGHTWHHSDRQLFEITKYGIQRFAPPEYSSDMPAFQNLLTDDDIKAVLAFLKSRWPERERAYQEEITRAAGGTRP